MNFPRPAAATAGSSDTLRVEATADGKVAIAGPLTFATARRARDLVGRVLATGGSARFEVDCAGITAGDSAGLAVLLDSLRAAKRAGQALRYTHLPAGLVALAGISEVEELLARGV